MRVSTVTIEITVSGAVRGYDAGSGQGMSEVSVFVVIMVATVGATQPGCVTEVMVVDQTSVLVAEFPAPLAGTCSA